MRCGPAWRICGERGVEVLTVFAFLLENWKPPAEEVSGLMELLAWRLPREVPQLSAEACGTTSWATAPQLVGEGAGPGLAPVAEAATASATSA
jgi:undecaprenyl diphosphate synthase